MATHQKMIQEQIELSVIESVTELSKCVETLLPPSTENVSIQCHDIYTKAHPPLEMALIKGLKRKLQLLSQRNPVEKFNQILEISNGAFILLKERNQLKARIRSGGNGPMIVCFITTSLSIIVMAIVLFSFPHKAPTEEIRQNQTPAPIESNATRAEYLKMYTEINENSANQIKQCHRIQRNLDDIDLVLKNVAEKYNQMERQLKTLYSTVSECGPENCGNLTKLFSPKPIKKCRKIKNLKSLKKQIRKNVTRMFCEAQIFSQWFLKLKDSEQHSTFNQKDKEARAYLLNSFKISFKTLINEINVTDLVWQDRCESSPRISNPQVSSLLNEWRVLQLSRNFVNGYMEQIKEMRECIKENGA